MNNQWCPAELTAPIAEAPIIANPFATRYTRPGALDYQFDPDSNTTDIGQLADRLGEQRFRGQIIGPHGSGKSTLMRSLAKELKRRGLDVIQQGHKKVSGTFIGSSLLRRGILLIDGFEQLPLWRRQVLVWTSRFNGTGLVVTAHQKIGLPMLMETSVTQRSTRLIVTQLCQSVGRADRAAELCSFLDRRLAAKNGNLREVLFELYDEW